MTAGPATPHSPRSRKPIQVMAFVGDADGSAPDDAAAHAAPWLLPIDIERVSGAAFNTLSCEIDLARLGDRYQDITVPIGVDRTVELRQVLNGNTDTLIAWGKLATNAIAWNKDQESSTVTCRLDPTALQLQLLESGLYYDNDAPAEISVERDLIFNPLEEGVVWGNRSTTQDANTAYYFLDHGSVRTATALTLQAQNPKRWTLAQAVHRLCWLCNPDEDRLTNPALTDLQNVLDNADRDAQFRNHTIRLGSTLFEALDNLLRPYSCGWYLDWSGELGSVTTELKVYKCGVGLTEPILAQRIGATVEAQKTNLARLDMNFDITAQPNRIVAVSGVKQYEVEIDLYPAWDPADDPTGVSAGYDDEYDQLGQDADYQIGGPKEHVGRKWAANESGEYNGWRTSQTEAQVLPNTVRRVRRPLSPCLTRARDGQQIGSRGYLLEWQDFEDTWREVIDAFQVARDEAAIWFSELPPVPIWTEYLEDKENYGLKLTATITVDDREQYETPRRTDSPQGQDHWLYLDLAERFSEKRLDSSSQFYDTRQFTLLSAVEHATTGDWILTLDGDVSDVLQVGQKIAVLDSTREGVYTAKAISGADVTVEEDASEIDGATGATHLVFVNTDAEGCAERLKQTATKARDDNDYALVAPTIQLHGLDHPQYTIGKLVPEAQPRNVAFAGRRDGSRSPQIVGVTYSFHGEQRTTLQLEQFRGLVTGEAATE